MNPPRFLSAAIAATFFVVPATAFAQPLPAVPLNANDPAINMTGNNAEVISISGVIPEYIQFTSVDNQLELGDLGGPLHTGLAGSTANSGFVASQSGGAYNGASGAYIYPSGLGVNTATGNLNTTPDGKAGIQFRSNTYIVCQSRADRVRNAGPDGLTGTGDDYVLTTGFATRYRGIATRYSTATPIVDGTTGLSNPSPGFAAGATSSAGSARGYSGYSGWTNVTADNTLLEQIIFKPGVQFAAPYDSNGYMFIARVARHGLNDYYGSYAGQLRLTYFKF
jgi:hypothetical protein